MDQPLWQIWLNVALIGFVSRRAAVGIGMYWDSLGSVLRVSYVGLLAVCAFAAIAIWLRRAWVIAALSAVAGAFAVTTLVELTSGHAFAPVWMVAQVIVVVTATALLARLAWREDSHGPV